MLPRNGRFQFPVLSMTYPKIRGEIMAAKGDPIFMRPLAEPEYSGAISMGIAHIGPIVNSEKKKATLRQIAASIRLRTKRIGTIAVSEQRKPPITKLRRAVLRFPVMISIRSLTIPPGLAKLDIGRVRRRTSRTARSSCCALSPNGFWGPRRSSVILPAGSRRWPRTRTVKSHATLTCAVMKR